MNAITGAEEALKEEQERATEIAESLRYMMNTAGWTTLTSLWESQIRQREIAVVYTDESNDVLRGECRGLKLAATLAQNALDWAEDVRDKENDDGGE